MGWGCGGAEGYRERQEGCVLRASHLSPQAQFLSLRWPGNLPDELGRPFPLNKSSFRCTQSVPLPMPHWRPAVAQSHVALAERSRYTGSIRVVSTPPPPPPTIESEIRQSRECGERGCPSLFPPGSTSPWPLATHSPDSD